MQKANDLDRSSTVLEQSTTLIAVIEMSLSTCARRCGAARESPPSSIPTGPNHSVRLNENFYNSP